MVKKEKYCMDAKKTLLVCKYAALSHMFVIKLIWQEVFKLCRPARVRDHSVMVTRLYLSATVLAISAITVAHGGVYLSSNWFTNMFCSVLYFQGLWHLSCRYQYNMSEGLGERHVEHLCRPGAIRRPSLPRQLFAFQVSNPAHWRGGGPVQLPTVQLQICKTGNENAEREPFQHDQQLIHPSLCRWRENTSYSKMRWSTGQRWSIKPPSPSFPFNVFIKGRVQWVQCLMNQQHTWNLRKLFSGILDLRFRVPYSCH